MKYRGITYPDIFDHEWLRRLWQRYVCPREIHLFDEVESADFEDGHRLYCDACGLTVVIKEIK